MLLKMSKVIENTQGRCHETGTLTKFGPAVCFVLPLRYRN